MTPTAEAQFILIRGLAREVRHWGEFPQILEEQFRKSGHIVRVDAIDQPGCGRYSEMRSPLTIRGITTFMREKYNELNARMRDAGETPPKKTYLLAVSLGGMVASDWLNHWPNDMDGAVFVNTSFGKFSPLHHRLRPRALEHLYKIIRATDPVEREREILKMVSNRPDIHDEVAKHWGELGLDRPVSLENFARQILAAATYRAPEECPSVPVLLLNGSEDRMVAPNCSDVIAEKWSVPIEKHETAGHDLPLDAPEWMAEKTLAWYSGLRATGKKS
jgi:pimeloyl-ACP methyl ester carboxylesterase